MEKSTRRYARKILLVHLLLLAAVLGVVALATRQVYSSARAQAIQQARVRQELLAAQTARGIESFYTSIISDLDLLRRAEPDENSAAQPTVGAFTALSGGLTAQPAGPGISGSPGPNTPARQINSVRLFSPILWNQLSGRVSAIFEYNRNMADLQRSVRVLEPRSQDALTTRGGRGDQSRFESGGGGLQGQTRGSATRPDVSRAGAFFAFGQGIATTRPEIVPPAQAARLTAEAQALAQISKIWLEHVTRPEVSRLLTVRPNSLLQRENTSGGVNLVAVPFIEGGPRVIVAVVPATEIQDRFLPPAPQRQITSATLIDDNTAVVASATAALVGMNLKDVDDPAIREILKDYAANPRKNTQAFDQPMTIGGAEISPRLVTVEPVELPRTKWCLLIASPMSEVDDIVAGIFRTVLYWAAFLVISMTAILVSTAVSLIRVRTRLERVQHEVITRELSQARQIQLNWLPNRHSAGTALDIAAVNQPASHISGDFYNWFDLPDGRQVVIVGDVTGHGMAAAFLMATTQLLVRTTMTRVGDPGACMEEVNRQLCTQVFHGQFVTMLIVVLDLENSVMELATAGHASPLISEGGGPFTPLPLKSQLVLAVDSEQTYTTERFQFAPQSSMVLYTDGVVDVQAENDERFDSRRLKSVLTGTFDSAQQIIDRLLAAVNSFRGKRELGDDLTLVAIQTQSVPRGAHLTEGAAAYQESTSLAAN
ncbi:MAG: serine/threonine-protein phosphatase [Planctomycetota bacterium]|nr:serine/threonine-protein phosphatase [Planctomycetota bacterium]